MVARTLRFADLFAGIGGFHAALQDLGARCVFACDIDPSCRSVYETNFGITPAGDIRSLTEGTRVQVPDHDVLCAGFPCQPFSKSGYQRGLEETRGTLFFNILKILEAKRPRYVLLENVRNLAGPRQLVVWETIIRNLRALGYRVSSTPAVFSPHLLPPDRGGRPQIRERVFILGEHVGTQGALEEPPRLDNCPVAGWDPQEWRIQEWLDPDDHVEELADYRLRAVEHRWLDAWNDLLAQLDDPELPSFPLWADAFVAQPNIAASTPEWKQRFLVRNSEFYRSHRGAINRWKERSGVSGFPASRRKFEWQARGWPRDVWELVIHLRPSGIRVKGPTYLPALVAITQTSVIGPRRRRITPREAARLQGFPDSFALHPDAGTSYRHLGNAVNVGAVRYVATQLLGVHRPSRVRNGAAILA